MEAISFKVVGGVMISIVVLFGSTLNHQCDNILPHDCDERTCSPVNLELTVSGMI